MGGDREREGVLIVPSSRELLRLLKKLEVCWWRSSLSSFRVVTLRCKRELAASYR